LARRSLAAIAVAVVLAAGCGGSSGSGTHSADDVSSALKDAGFTRVSVADASSAGGQLGGKLPNGVSGHLQKLVVGAKPDSSGLTLATVLVLDDSASAKRTADYLKGVAPGQSTVIVHDNLVGLAVGNADTRQQVADVVNGI
jgi:hypothetical protein